MLMVLRALAVSEEAPELVARAKKHTRAWLAKARKTERYSRAKATRLLKKWKRAKEIRQRAEERVERVERAKRDKIKGYVDYTHIGEGKW